MKFDVICFGSGLIDIFADTDVAEKKDMIAYNVGDKIQIHNLEFNVGGGGVNTSATFSKMGLKTGFFGNIGNDKLSEKILGKIKKDNVKFVGLKKGRTGYSIILDSKEHNRTILTFKGDNDGGFGKVNLDTKWFYFSSMNGKSFKTQLDIAKSGKYKIAYNPSLYLFGKQNVKEIVKRCEILILNKEEADCLNKKHEEILKIGPKIVVVTNGKEDFFCYTKENVYRIKPHRNVKVVERTGAGDAFSSAFVCSYIKTEDVVKSLQIGVANSESVVRYKGATNKILSWEEANKEIEKNGCEVKKIK